MFQQNQTSTLEQQFKQDLVPQKNSKNLAVQMNNSIIKQVEEDIMSSKVAISNKSVLVESILQSQKDKANNNKNANQNLNLTDKKLSQIFKKKRELQGQLKRVNYEQNITRDKRPGVMAESQEGKTKYFRSTLTPEQKNNINKIIKSTKKFEDEIARKTMILKKKIEQNQEQQQLKKLERKRAISSHKKNQVAKKLQILKQRKYQRDSEITSASKQFEKVKKQKFLHQIIDEKWKIAEATEQQENQKLKYKNREQNKFNYNQIMTHSRRYSEIVNQNKQNRQNNQQRFQRDMFEKSRMQKHTHSVFFKTISEEQIDRKKIEEQRMMSSQIFMTKKTLYAQTVREKFKSKSKLPANLNKSKSKETEKSPQNKRVKSLDYFSLNKLGNDYMKKINACIGEEQIHRSRQQIKDQPKVFKYKDYLTQARNKKEIVNPQTPKQSQELKQIRKLIRNKRSMEKSQPNIHPQKVAQNRQDKANRLLKAKILADQLNDKALDDNKTKTLIDSIAAKICIIQQYAK